MLGLAFCSHNSLNRFDLTELITALPFGKAEQAHLMGISNHNSRLSSSASLTALKKLTDLGKGSSQTDLTILRTEYGKPHFASLPLYFSLTHANSLSAAVICDRPVGIDLEFIREYKNAERISARFFTPHEQKEFLPANESADSFFSIWTKKEALSKLDGRGLSALSALDTKNGFFREFQITFGTAEAILNICFDRPNDEEIFILNDENIKIFEK